jgi:toxin ParE1/3/4
LTRRSAEKGPERAPGDGEVAHLASPLAAAAEDDFQDVLRWTAEHFGDRQARVYARTLSMAFEALAAGPTVVGAKARNDIAKGLFMLHVARHGRKGRHFVMFRIGHDQGRDVIEILRLLHDAMDLPRHL